MKLTKIEAYEIQSFAFRVMTGYVAPGKDPSPMADEAPYEERCAAWDEWRNKYARCILAMLHGFEALIDRDDDPISRIEAALKAEQGYYSEIATPCVWKQGYRQGRASATGKAEDFEALADMVRGWATERQIIPNSTPTAQLLKTMSELGELADATTKNSKHEITDGVGDVLVCLINYCALQNIDPVVCLHEAYNQIKDRKGTLLPSGVFVKENQ